MATSAITEAEDFYRKLTIRAGQDVGNQIPRFRRFRRVGTTGGLCWFHAIADRYCRVHRWMPGRTHLMIMEGSIFWCYGLVTFWTPSLNPVGRGAGFLSLAGKTSPLPNLSKVWSSSSTASATHGWRRWGKTRRPPRHPSGSGHFNCRKLLPFSSFSCESISLMGLVAIP